jgi:hypothetical protein
MQSPPSYQATASQVSHSTYLESNYSDTEEQTVLSSQEPAALSNPPPAILKRVNAQRHVLWDSTLAEPFLEWWAETPVGITNSSKKDRKIRWDRPKTSKHWSFFQQAASIKNGEAAIICRLCSKVLIHPSTGNSGTTNMKTHLKSSSCGQNRRGGVQKDILDLLLQVCDPLSIVTGFCNASVGSIAATTELLWRGG